MNILLNQVHSRRSKSYSQLWPKKVSVHCAAEEMEAQVGKVEFGIPPRQYITGLLFWFQTFVSHPLIRGLKENSIL